MAAASLPGGDAPGTIPFRTLYEFQRGIALVAVFDGAAAQQARGGTRVVATGCGGAVDVPRTGAVVARRQAQHDAVLGALVALLDSRGVTIMHLPETRTFFQARGEADALFLAVAPVIPTRVTFSSEAGCVAAAAAKCIRGVRVTAVADAAAMRYVLAGLPHLTELLVSVVAFADLRFPATKLRRLGFIATHAASADAAMGMLRDNAGLRHLMLPAFHSVEHAAVRMADVLRVVGAHGQLRTASLDGSWFELGRPCPAAAALARHTRLRGIRLPIGAATDAGALVQFIEQHPALRSVSLVLNDFVMGDDAFCRVCDALRRLASLTLLTVINGATTPRCRPFRSGRCARRWRASTSARSACRRSRRRRCRCYSTATMARASSRRCGARW
jgi:hypothetical protein